MNPTCSVIPIFFSSDDNYLPCLAVSIRSLIDNASADYCYRIHILNNGLTENRVALLTAMSTDRVSIVPVDVSREIAPIAEKLNLRDYYTASIYFRIFIASMFPQYQKAIYLDADITVNGDISGLYNIPLGSRILGVIPDDIIAGHRDFRNYSEQALGIPYRRYFNSGVMLMNLDQFRLQEIEQKFIYLLNKYHFDTICPDQDYLNLLCQGRVLYLDKGWNKMSVDDRYEGVPNLVHFNMFYKPWQYDNIFYQDYFWKYASKTPFYEELRAIQRGFNWRGKLAHARANYTLHRHAKRISASDNNFFRILSAAPQETPESDSEAVYEA